MRTTRWLQGAVALLAAAALLPACSSDDSGSADSNGDGAATIRRVPEDFKTIQAAVDAAKPGDMVLIGEGTYNEAVDVTTEDITLRGVDRNKVILDGEFKLENGVRVLETDGVQVENMTARNYVSNGFFWTGSDRYRGSYLTAYRNGDYGVYSFDAYHGQFDNSLGAGSPDAGFYIGECYKCDALIDNVVSENNGLGYSGTNSGGDLWIVNSTFRNNRAGVVPNSGSYELCYPSRETTIVGNLVYDNNMLDGPGIDVSLLAQGNGILMAGAVNAVVERNRVWNHERTGIAAVPFPEEDANDAAPPESEWATPCEETRDDPQPGKDKAPDTVLWNAIGNRVVGNVVEGSKMADIASATLALTPDDPVTKDLKNCFSDNTIGTSAPSDLQGLAPCDGSPTATDWEAGALDLVPLIADQPDKPAKDSYKTTPVPEEQPSMEGDLEKIPAKFTAPEKPDLEAIEVPEKPAGT